MIVGSVSRFQLADGLVQRAQHVSSPEALAIMRFPAETCLLATNRSSRTMKSCWKDESGQTLVLGAMVLSVLMGFLALALDVGMLFHARTQMQIAADSAAAAAALDYKYSVAYSGKTSAQSAHQDAVTAATQNGMLPSGTVTINNPPTSG